MVILEIDLDAFEDLDRILNRRLIDVDLLEPTRQRAVFFEMLAEFFVGCGPHAAQLATR